MISFELYKDAESTQLADKINLGATLIEDGQAGFGEPMQLWVRNEGDIPLVTANINVEGGGSHLIQLARDEDGKHGVWAARGQGIIALTEKIIPGESFSFWARGIFTEDDAPETKEINFRLQVVGING